MKYGKRRLGLIILAAVLLFSLAGCTDEADGAGMNIPEPDQEILDAFDVVLANTSNEFGFELYRNLVTLEDNIMISPTSIYTALAMTINGAGGETFEAMADMLGMESEALEKFNRNNLARLYKLQEADPDVIINIANSLWMKEGEAFDQDFVDRNQRYYNASAKALDFGAEASVDVINSWVNDRTDGLIEDIVEYPIDPNTILFLINAVYFQGDWTDPFNTDLTSNDFFNGPEGEIPDVPFMNRNDEFDYLEKEGAFQAVRLPYGESERLAMVVFLPDENSSLLELAADLNMENWNQWREEFQTYQGHLRLPRFSMEYEEKLNDVLKLMGMKVAFDPAKSDFYGMVTRNEGPRLYISEVKHKSFIDVDEKGTEAAAVTSVEIRVESAMIDFFEMNVNRPFFFMIHDRETNEVLFTGSVVDPTQ
ncbi:serpin family protein [Anoxynatronum buryatiense]|uniref:Serpin B n=1 Tax=Anoxynatronum buryatiense TaxID=489973 RepID=A0AA45WXD6_9CLOT|nr:serpin family protein [Anoxynatronum buryatiense]SMP63993.1 serpin B [Anoxynatronum buryatiense]